MISIAGMSPGLWVIRGDSVNTNSASYQIRGRRERYLKTLFPIVYKPSVREGWKGEILWDSKFFNFS